GQVRNGATVRTLALAGSGVALLGAVAVTLAAERSAAIPKIDPAAIRAHLKFLADDLLEGREAGSRGYEIAARYVAAEFEERGLQPGAPDGSFFHPVPLRRTPLVPEASRLALGPLATERVLEPARDYVAAPDAFRETAEASGSLGYVGFGIRAPERKHHDYRK